MSKISLEPNASDAGSINKYAWDGTEWVLEQNTAEIEQFGFTLPLPMHKLGKITVRRCGTCLSRPDSRQTLIGRASRSNRYS